MPRIDLLAVGETREARSLSANNQKTLNWYPQIEGNQAGNPLSLYPTPGLKRFFKAGGGAVRGNGIIWNNEGYMVSGSQVIKIDTSGVVSIIGNLTTVDGRISMARGRSMFMIVDGVKGWTYDGTTFAEVTDADFPSNPKYVTWLKDYFVVPQDDSDGFQISAIDDGTSWNALDFATAESLPDTLRRPETLAGYLYLFGDLSVEVWYATTNPDFPFEVYQNGVMDWGIDAPDSIGKADNALFWLATNEEGNLVVLSTRGIQATIVSNRDIEWQINQLSKTNDAEGFCYRESGHTFYVLTFPTAKVTIVYDVATGMWHNRESWELGRYRVAGHLFFNRQHIVGDYLTNQFYTFDNDTYTDNLEPIERLRRTPLYNENHARIFWARLEAEFQQGIGLDNIISTGSGFDPKVVLRWSNDKGRTWSNEEWRNIGKVGEYNQRAIWNCLGSSDERMFELKVTDPVNAVLIQCFADMTTASYT